MYYYYFSLRWGQQDSPNWIWPKRLERTMVPNDRYCVSEVMVCPRRVCTRRWAGKEPPGKCSASHHPLTYNCKALNPIHDTIHGDYSTQRNQKTDKKCLICLFLNVAVCLMNEIDFIKCQGYLLVSNLEYKHTPDPSACSYNRFKVKHVE